MKKIEPLGRLSARDGQCEDRETAGSDASQRLDAGAKRATGGDDVVHQKNMPCLQIFGIYYAKDVLHILFAIGFPEPRLMFVVAKANKMSRINRYTRCLAEAQCDIIRLVVAAQAQPTRMQRNGHDEVDIVEESRVHPFLCRLLSQKYSQFRPVSVFNMPDESPCIVQAVGGRVRKGGDGFIEKKGPASFEATNGGKMLLSTVLPQEMLLRTRQ